MGGKQPLGDGVEREVGLARDEHQKPIGQRGKRRTGHAAARLCGKTAGQLMKLSLNFPWPIFIRV